MIEKHASADVPALYEREYEKGIVCESLASITMIGTMYSLMGAEKALEMAMGNPKCGLSGVYFRARTVYVGSVYKYKKDGVTTRLQVLGVRPVGSRKTLYCFIEVDTLPA